MKQPGEGAVSATNAIHRCLQISAAGTVLQADIGLPESPRGAVLFAHGSGRHSPRIRYVADELNRAGLVTVLADLLTRGEEQLDLRTACLRFDIDLLAGRVMALTDWMADNEPTAGLRVGLFGASTSAAAALIAAVALPATVQAVVSRGGRPDLADEHLHEVHHPTLLIVGERDPIVVDLNRQAMERLAGETRLVIIPVHPTSSKNPERWSK
jgi:putative phosphoribosyl transferase